MSDAGPTLRPQGAQAPDTRGEVSTMPPSRPGRTHLREQVLYPASRRHMRFGDAGLLRLPSVEKPPHRLLARVAPDRVEAQKSSEAGQHRQPRRELPDPVIAQDRVLEDGV